MFKDLLLLILNFFKKNNNSEEIEKKKKDNNKIKKHLDIEEKEKEKEKLEKERKKEEKRIKKEIKKDKKEQSKSFLFKKRKKKKDYAYITVTFVFSFLILIFYLISSTISFITSNEESFIATIDKKYNPYKLNYSVLIREYESGNEVGDILELDNEGHSCFDSKKTCFNYIIKEIKNNKVYLDFKNVEVQKEISIEDYKLVFDETSIKNKIYIKNYRIIGKIVNKKFLITRIEFNSD